MTTDEHRPISIAQTDAELIAQAVHCLRTGYGFEVDSRYPTMPLMPASRETRDREEFAIRDRVERNEWTVPEPPPAPAPSPASAHMNGAVMTNHPTPTVYVDQDTAAVDGLAEPAPQGWLWRDLPTLLRAMSRRFDAPELTVLVGAAGARTLGLPQKAPRTEKAAKSHPAIVAAMRDGWKAAELGPWTILRGDDERPTIYLGIVPWLPARSNPLLAPENPTFTTRRLAAFTRATGVGWRATPGACGVAMIRGARYRHTPRWISAAPQEALSAHLSPVLGWTAPETPPGRFVHGYDAIRAYLGAMSGAMLAADELQPSGWTDQVFDPAGAGATAAGYYQVVLPHWADSRIPPPWGDHEYTGQPTVITAPTLRLIVEMAETWGTVTVPTIERSWTAPGTRILRPWAETVRDVLARAADADDQEMVGTMKRLYTETYGLFGASGGRIDRRDWHDTIAAHASATVWRRAYNQLLKHDRAPVAVQTDAVYYASDQEDAGAEWPEEFPRKTGLGGTRVVGTLDRAAEVTA